MTPPPDCGTPLGCAGVGVLVILVCVVVFVLCCWIVLHGGRGDD